MINRSVAPDIITPKSVDILHFETVKSANNIDLHYINTGTQDVIRVSVVFCAGVKYQDVSFQASATASMITEGTLNYTSEQFAEKMDFYGIYFDQSIDRDFSVITMCCLKKFLKEGMDLLKEALCDPIFKDEELDIYKSKRKQQLTIERTKIDVQARELFIKTLFGDNHPYGKVGKEDEYDQLTSEHLRDLYNRLYISNNCFSVASGKIEADDLSEILYMLSCLKSSSDVSYVKVKPQSKEDVFVKKDDSLQSSIRIGRILFDRSHPDFIAMQVMTTILGGYFGSRLVKNLREDKGYTYGIFAGMINLEDSGYIAITSEVAAEFTEDAIKEVFYEIERLSTEKVGDEELQMVKNVMIGEILRVLDGPFGINDVIIENIQNKTDNNYITLMINQINAITSNDLLEVSKKYLLKEMFSTVVVGNIITK